MSAAGGAGGCGRAAGTVGGGAALGQGKGRAGYDAFLGKGKGTVKGKGAAMGAGAAARAEQRGGAVAALAAICAYGPEAAYIIEADLAADSPIADGCSADRHAALLTAGGDILCQGANEAGQLGKGHRAPHRGIAPVPLPWPAAAVRCGGGFSLALRRGGGAVCSWGESVSGVLGRGGDGALPAEVWLPEGDPIVLLEAGGHSAIAVTQSDMAYGWGSNHNLLLAIHGLPIVGIPIPILDLSGRGVRRLACGVDRSLAETRDDGLLVWGRHGGHPTMPVPLLPSAGRVALPLRCLAATGAAAAAAGADGRLWFLRQHDMKLRIADPGPEEPVARVGGISGIGPTRGVLFVALTAWGRLWECRPGYSRPIAARAPRQVLLPRGGGAAGRILLLPDLSCGLFRCRLLLLAAGRRMQLPGGEMRRVALVPFLVDDDFIFE
eukprot:TRINITY_DN13689_c0_g3_i1.p1 TRINITY_DN13689_c0_g3~~TRINITY_DN13689_c0_g3_i1.p1  ORF type:complete len:462 (+),score=73.60 TRINITY_DN13689_c0_g3_i1:76-1386(+)